MIFLKKKSTPSLIEIEDFFSSHQDEIELIENILKYHENFELKEDMIKLNGRLAAIYQFYLDDKKEQLMLLKTNPNNQSVLERIKADDQLLSELEKILPIYYQIIAYKKLKEKIVGKQIKNKR